MSSERRTAPPPRPNAADGGCRGGIPLCPVASANWEGVRREMERDGPLDGALMPAGESVSLVVVPSRRGKIVVH